MDDSIPYSTLIQATFAGFYRANVLNWAGWRSWSGTWRPDFYLAVNVLPNLK